MNAAFFLVLALVLSVVGCTLLYLRQRTPTSDESGIDTFRREMHALASRTTNPPRRRLRRR